MDLRKVIIDEVAMGLGTEVVGDAGGDGLRYLKVTLIEVHTIVWLAAEGVLRGEVWWQGIGWGHGWMKGLTVGVCVGTWVVVRYCWVDVKW